MFCKYCGKELPNNSKFCIYCGKPVEIINPYAGNTVPQQVANPSQQPFNNNSNFNQPVQNRIQDVLKTNLSKNKSRNRNNEIVIKKKSSGCLTIFIALFILALGIITTAVLIGSNENDDSTNASYSTTVKNEFSENDNSTNASHSTTAKKGVSEKTQRANLKKQFKAIGLSADEAKNYSNIFYKLGIREIHNIEALTGTGLDGLQAYRCQLYDYTSLQVNFTIENRVLCSVEIAGLPSTKTDSYIGMFGKLKTKESQSTTSVTMYDQWDNNGEIDYNKNPYLAKFDYEHNKISAFNK